MRLSLVVPCFNEERGLGRLRQRLVETLPGIIDDFEVLLVDDGSTDGTLGRMREITTTDPRFRYIALSRNFGKEAAMLAGLSQADGDGVGVMDADLQHPPELLGRMIDALREGYDQVVARRTRAGDAALRSLLSTVFYKAINKLVEVELENGVGDFRVLSRKAVRALLALGEYNRFSKGLFSWIGFDTAVIDYENVPRQDGSSRWSFRKLIDYGIDGVVSFNNRPLRLAIYLGILSTLVAFGYAINVLVEAIIRGNPVPGYVTIMVGVAGPVRCGGPLQPGQFRPERHGDGDRAPTRPTGPTGHRNGGMSRSPNPAPRPAASTRTIWPPAWPRPRARPHRAWS